MKKRLLFFLLTAAVLALVFGMGVLLAAGASNAPLQRSLGRTGNRNGATAVQNKTPSTENLPLIKADVEVFGNSMTVREEIYLETPASSAVLYLYPRIRTSATITQVAADGGLSSFSVDGLYLRVECEQESSVITVQYELTLPSDGDILSMGTNMAVLTNFLVVPQVYIGDQPVEIHASSFGDPYVYEDTSYHITLRCESRFEAYAPGKLSDNVADGVREAEFYQEHMRDFPLVLSDGASLSTGKVGDVTVYYVDSAGTAPFVEYVLPLMEEKVGAYPHDELFVVKAPLARNSGMEYSGMILLDPACFSSVSYLKSVTYHELLHQWFYGVIGSDQLDEPFLDEGLVTFMTSLLQNGRPQGSWSRTSFTRRLSDYSSKSQYQAAAYDEAARYFAQLHGGDDEAFYASLKRLYEDHAFGFIRFSDLEAYFTAN